MKFLSLAFVVIFFNLVERLEGTNWTRCDQLPANPLNYRTLVLYSPYFIYRSIGPNPQCAVGVATGLVKKNEINFITFVGNQIVSNRRMKKVKRRAHVVDCNSNATVSVQFIVSKKRKGYRFWCAYTCSADGSAIAALRCYGRNKTNEAAIQTYLHDHISQIPGYRNLVNSQTNCTHTQNCLRFNNYIRLEHNNSELINIFKLSIL